MIIIKTPPEITLIREACKIVSEVLKNIEKEIREGITTEELDRIAESLIYKLNGLPAFKGYRGYKYATCISVNHEVVHGLPGTRHLMSGDIVSFDVGVIYKGYYGDAAKTFTVGKVSKTAQKLIRCAKESLSLAIAQARAGNFLGDISWAIEKHALRHGFSVVRDLFGHGVGKSLHEDPLIPNFGKPKSGPELKPGMVLAIEPMVNVGGSHVETLDDGWTVVTQDKSLSSHFEHTILITKGKAEVLTKR